MEYLAAIIAEGPDRSSVQGFQFLLQDMTLLARSPPPKPIITAPTGGGRFVPTRSGMRLGSVAGSPVAYRPGRGGMERTSFMCVGLPLRRPQMQHL